MTVPEHVVRKDGGEGEPAEPTDEKMYTSEPVEGDDGETIVIRQQNVGPGSELGGGEWPDPHTPPSTEPKTEESTP